MVKQFCLPNAFLVVALCSPQIIYAFTTAPSSPISSTSLYNNVASGPRFRTIEEMNGGSSSYVPAGLTPEQYNEIKQKEESELAKKNFGAWGPRFARSIRPEGDWMVMPSLWTNGFQSQPNTNGNEMANQPLSLITRMILVLRESIPSLVLSTILWTTLVSAAIMRKAGTARTVVSMTKLVGSRIFQNKAKLFLATALSAIPIQKLFFEKINRKWLWSPRRSVLTSTIVSAASLALWFSFCSLGIV